MNMGAPLIESIYIYIYISPSTHLYKKEKKNHYRIPHEMNFFGMYNSYDSNYNSTEVGAMIELSLLLSPLLMVHSRTLVHNFKYTMGEI